MKKRWFSIFLTAVILLNLLASVGIATDGVQEGDPFTYTKAEHWGVDSEIWSWQWAKADSTDFYDMVFTNIDGQGEVYAADWETYPYCAARNGGINVHPNAKADAARVFTAPASGWVTVDISVARTAEMVVAAKNTPTSFRILLENATVYPTKGAYRVLTSKEPEDITIRVFVKKGEHLRFVVGAMDNQTSDAVNLYTTVTYDTVEPNAGEVLRVGEVYAYEKTSATWGTEDPHWSWEWALAGKTSFSPMTWQYVEKYGKSMYASDWATHPYNYVDALGVKLHPAETADTVKTFTVPHTGTVNLHTEVSRYVALADVNNTAANGTSLRILVNNTQVYPLYSNYLVLDSTTAKVFDLSLPVAEGDKIRIVIGGMGQVTSDAVKLYNTVTYTDLNTPELCVSDKDSFSVNDSQFAANAMGNWSFEYRDSNDTFGDMTYQYVEKYNKYMYASDWTAHAYNYVDLLGVKMHPAKTRDVVKTYTAPHDGRIEMAVKVARYFEYVAEGSQNPTSLRVYKNNEQIWPTNGGQKEITSATAATYRICADVRTGDKIRCVVGSMGNTTQDGISMYNTVTYRAVGLRELAAFMDQYNQRIDVIDVQGDNLNSAERAWSWKPTTALGYTDLATFNSPTDAKIRYNKTEKKYVVAVCSSRGFMGVVDFATGKKLWQVSLSDSSNPHAIEYLPNGNVAVAASIGNWLRIYTASQGSGSAKYTEVTLDGAHGVLWDPDRKVLWGLGAEVITAYTIGGTAAAPTLTEVTKYRASVPASNGHDLSPVYGNKDRLWVSSNSVYQYDIPSKQFLLTYEYGNAISRAGVKGISNFPDSHTTIHVFANNTYLAHDSDRVFVTLTDKGEIYGRTHTHNTGAYYKVRSWISAYNSSHKTHVAEVVPGIEATCEAAGLTDGSQCSICGKILTEQSPVPALGHSYVYSPVSRLTHRVTCQKCDLSAEAEHSYTEGYCICGEPELKEPVEDASLKLKHSLNLASDISVNLVISKSALEGFDMDTVYVESTINTFAGNEQTGTSNMRVEPVESGNYYYFTLDGLTAVQMNNTISSVLYGTKNGQPYYSPVDEYSIATYAYSMLNSTTDTKMLTLCADLLRYGAEAQSFKKYRTDALVDAQMTDAHRSYLSNTEALTFTSTDASLNDLADPAITWVGKTLDLGSKVGLKFVFNTKNYSGDISKLSMKVSYLGSTGETKTVTLTGAEVYNVTNSYYSFSFYGLLASELRTVVDVAVFEGDTQLTETLRYSAESYAARNAAGSLAPLCKALFAYSDSAKTYFQG